MLEQPPHIDHLYIGSASWKYPSWEGLIYPEHLSGDTDAYLKYYAEYYNMVEIDQYFWSLFPPEYAKMPDREEIEHYVSQVPDYFRFTVKAPNSLTLTHFYKRQSPKYREYAGEENPYGFLNLDLWNQFIRNLEPMHGQIGSIILQFSYLNKSMMSGVSEFLDKLGSFLAEADMPVSLAVESRNPNYLGRKYFEFLKEWDIPHVYLSGYYMPPVRDIYRKYGNTGPFSMFRLHGEDRKGMDKKTGKEWNEIVRDQRDELSELADIVQDEIRLERDVYFSINNHYEGSTPISIQRFLEEW
jgi:uncharacterized protein YecE (DUF72 family)